jgi:hypothetical protein
MNRQSTDRPPPRSRPEGRDRHAATGGNAMPAYTVGCQVVARNGCVQVLRRNGHLERVRWGEVVPVFMQLCKGGR